jgi:hypothetical protein
MDVFGDLMKEQGTPVYTITLPNSSRVEQFVQGWFMAQTAAREYAIKAGLDPSSAPLVAEFKKRL